jgi:hypothetical protein
LFAAPSLYENFDEVIDRDLSRRFAMYTMSTNPFFVLSYQRIILYGMDVDNTVVAA